MDTHWPWLYWLSRSKLKCLFFTEYSSKKPFNVVLKYIAASIAYLKPNDVGFWKTGFTLLDQHWLLSSYCISNGKSWST
jgi:E3 ubiquitin-protein ligase DOA10